MTGLQSEGLLTRVLLTVSNTSLKSESPNIGIQSVVPTNSVFTWLSVSTNKERQVYNSKPNNLFKASFKNKMSLTGIYYKQIYKYPIHFEKKIKMEVLINSFNNSK